jgi:hypothetical protein
MGTPGKGTDTEHDGAQLAMPHPKVTLMPSRRNYAAELAQLGATAADRQRALYRMMRQQLPEYELALTGWNRVLTFLHDLGIRRSNGHTLTRRIVQRWARTDGFPLVRGTWHPRSRTPCLTTSFAVTSWMLTRADTRSLFRVYDSAQSVSAQRYRSEGRTLAPLDTRRP